MKLVIDTCAYSALVRQHKGVIDAMLRCESVLLSPVVLGELRYGFRGGDHERNNLDVLSRFIAKHSVQLIDISFETAEIYGEIQHYLKSKGLPIPTNDIWIAASAMQHGGRVLTTDAHFQRIPQIMTEYVPASQI
jgi:tRNA(fMet)-specific endonuclease VapC